MSTTATNANSSPASSATSSQAYSLQQTSKYSVTECRHSQHNLQTHWGSMESKSITQPKSRIKTNLTTKTSTSSSSQSSSSVSSLPAVAIDGESRSNRSLPKKPKDYKRHHRDADSPVKSDPDSVSDEGVFRGNSGIRKTLRPKRRRVTTNATIQSRFSSPDRYATGRERLQHDTSPIRTTFSHTNLRGIERYDRQRDLSVDPFRPVRNHRARTISTLPLGLQSQYVRAPHYIPSFVHGEDAGLNYVSSQPNEFLHRRVSLRTAWSVGGRAAIMPPGQLHGIQVGIGELLTSGSTAPMWNTNFIDIPTLKDKKKTFEQRVAFALGIDQVRRVLPVINTIQSSGPNGLHRYGLTVWQNWSWKRAEGRSPDALQHMSDHPEKAVPSVAFRVLDAPRLKDDFYCSVLAYSNTCRTLAVALTHRVYLWTEQYGVRYPPLPPVRPTSYVMSLAFSSDQGGRAILAIGRSSGQVTLWSLLEQNARMELTHPTAACCLSFRPTVTLRRPQLQNSPSECEDMLVSDDSGHIHYYSVEWSRAGPTSATLLVKLDAHSQNICGLSWSPDGRCFVSGGNDNAATLFVVDEVLSSSGTAPAIHGTSRNRLMRIANNSITASPQAASSELFDDHPAESRSIISGINDTLNTGTIFPLLTSGSSRGREGQGSLNTAPDTPPRSPPGRRQKTTHHLVNPNILALSNAHKHIFKHSAAVKAIAFAPWQPTLLATGGGSNDKQIHFHHTESGSTLAVINVFAQVTSLTWSTTRREIAATFGYAQPEHEVRIAVFDWPSCRCVVSIPWERKSNGEIGRALWAIPYPGGPNDTAPESGQKMNNDVRTWDPVRRDDVQTTTRFRNGLPTPENSPERLRPGTRGRSISPARAACHSLRTEGEIWASRTEEEGSMIIACCDQTVKFFEVWAGKSKGKSRGLGSKVGVLGGSKVLEGWCEGVGVEEVNQGLEVIR